MYTWVGQFFRRMGGAYEMCEFWNPSCPFKALVLKGSDFPEYRQRWTERYPVENPGWKPRQSNFPIGYQTDSVNTLAYSLLAGRRPTNGLQALLTFAFVCNSLTVYGFSGSETADGHPMGAMHSLDIEHTLISKLVHGNFTDVKSILGTLDPELAQRLQGKEFKVRIVNPRRPASPR